jgi:hypothetical protein
VGNVVDLGEFEYVADLDGPEVIRPYIYLSDIDDNGYDDLLCIHGWKVEYWRNMAGSSSHDESVKSVQQSICLPQSLPGEVKLELARDTANHQAVVDIYNLRARRFAPCDSIEKAAGYGTEETRTTVRLPRACISAA